MLGRIFNDDDRIVDDQSNRQNKSEQREHVHGESEQRKKREGADNGDRYGGGRYHDGPPVLQEHQDYHQDKDAGLDEGSIDLIDRSFDKFCRIKRDIVFQTGGETFGKFHHFGLNRFGQIERVGARQLVDGNSGGGKPLLFTVDAVILAAQFDSADVAEKSQFAIVTRFDDNLFKFGDFCEPTFDVECELKFGIFRCWRCSKLTGCHLNILSLDRFENVLHREIT